MLEQNKLAELVTLEELRTSCGSGAIESMINEIGCTSITEAAWCFGQILDRNGALYNCKGNHKLWNDRYNRNIPGAMRVWRGMPSTQDVEDTKWEDAPC